MSSFINLLLTVLATVLVFGIIILIHEFGHFIMARLMGVRVNEFAMGMGPKLVRIQGKETLYSIRAFPIGGFCAMEGEDEESGDPRAFGSKKVWKRIMIIIAGAAMNLLLGFVLLLIYCGVHTNYPTQNAQTAFFSTTVGAFDENASSEATGLMVGDEIVRVNGKGIINFFEITTILASDEDGLVDFTVKRTDENGEVRKIDLQVQLSMKTDKTTNESVPYLDFRVFGVPKTFTSLISEAAKMELAVGRLVWRSLVDIVTGKFGLNDLAGPIGVGGVIGDVVENIQNEGWHMVAQLVFLVILLTVNVGIFNLLPLPALDGGRLIFLLFEAIFRRKVNPKYEGWVHAVGLILLLALMAVVAFNDIFRLITGG